MKTLVLYSTKRGATRQVAEEIAERIPGAHAKDLKEAGNLPLKEYGQIILGSSLTAGMVGKELKAFLKRHHSLLLEKELGLFLLGLDENGVDSYFQGNFSTEILAHTRAKAFLGGVYDPAQCGPVTRALLKKISGVSEYTSTIDGSRLKGFAESFAAS